MTACMRWIASDERACGEPATELIIVESQILEIIAPVCEKHFAKTDALIAQGYVEQFNEAGCFFYEGPLYTGDHRKVTPACEEASTDTVIVREITRVPYLGRVCPLHKLRHDSTAMHKRKAGL